MFDAVYSNQIAPPNNSWSVIHEHTPDDLNVKITKLWTDAYEILYKSNLIMLSAYENVVDDLSSKLIAAQARAIRAYINYKLLKWFGQFPIVDELENDFPVTNSAEEIIEFIKYDAIEASAFLPEVWASTQENKISKSFSQGVLSRIYLFSEGYNEAYLMNHEIFNSGTYSISSTTEDFQADNPEFFWGFAKGSNQEFNTFFDKGSFVPVLRLTETVLSIVESAYMLANTGDALNYLNILKVRSGEEEISNIDMNIIYQQYKKELKSEGELFLLMKRFGKALDELQIPEYRLILPIPRSALENNPNMWQNPGY